jgi:macrodomain Ter protein organizer (MatP/YcbG family)
LLTDYRLQSTAEFKAVVGRQLAVVKKLDILPKETINQLIEEKKEEPSPRKGTLGSMKANLKLPQLGEMGRGFEEARWPIILAVSILILTLLTWVGFFFYHKSLQSKKDSLNKRADEIYTSSNKDMTAKILDLEKDLKQVKKLIDAHVYPSRTLKFLEDYILPNVQLLDFSLDVNSGIITASGAAQTYAILAKQILLLEKQESIIESVRVSDISLGQLGGIGFSMEIIINGNFLSKKE